MSHISLEPCPVWVHHPGCISELVALIFSYLDDKTLGRAACACRMWADVALGVRWREVHDLRYLFSMLAPLSKPERLRGRQPPHSSARFKRPLHDSDWARFTIRFAPRVRHIYYDEGFNRISRKLLHESVFEEIARTCPPVIFPNLISLTWHATSAKNQHASLSFLHSSICRLSLQIFPALAPGLLPQGYLAAVAARTPNVTRLSLRADMSMRPVEDDVMALVRGLQRMRIFTAPPYSLTSRIVAELAKLPDLAIIDTIVSELFGPGVGDRRDVGPFLPVLLPNAFPALRKLRFSATIADATALFASLHAPSEITSLHVHVLVTDVPPVLHRFFTTIATRCRALTALYVDFDVIDAVLTVPPPSLSQRPTLDTFRPLFTCSSLTTFVFRWDYALALNQADIAALAVGWAHLEVLQLNCEPAFESDRAAPLSLCALLPFARYCPRLRVLGVYLAAAPVDFGVAPLVPFARLERLVMGASSIAEAGAVALALSALVPRGCQVEAGLRGPDGYGLANRSLDAAVSQRMTEWWVEWRSVDSMIPLLVEARDQERRRCAAAREESERMRGEEETLRARVRLLEMEVARLRGQRVLTM